MNFDFSQAAALLTNPITYMGIAIGVAAIVGFWKGAKALAKSAQEENERNAKIEASLAEVRRVVTPLDPARLGIKSTRQP